MTDDFGFTMHEDPGEVDEGLRKRVSDEAIRRINEKNKIDDIMKIINPLLEGLKANPDQPYIKWTNRVMKIEDIQKQLQKIVTRGW